MTAESDFNLAPGAQPADESVGQKMRRLKWPFPGRVPGAPNEVPEAGVPARTGPAQSEDYPLQQIAVADMSGVLKELSGARLRIDELTDRLTEALKERANDAARAASSEAREFDLAAQLKAAHQYIETLTAALEQKQRSGWRRLF